MLRMSKLADYGAIVMTYIAQQPERLLSAGDIAAAVRLELPTVSKLLKQLTHAGLLASRRGVAGGYRLARPAQAISVADILDAIEGRPMGLTECSSTPGLCTRELHCAVRANWQRISGAIRHILTEVTLAELAAPESQVVAWSKHAGSATPDPGNPKAEVRDEHNRQAAG